MTDSSKESDRVKRMIAPSLFIGGIVAGLLGIITLTVDRGALMAGLLLLFGGVGAIAMAQLIELLTDIAGHLAAIRAQELLVPMGEIAKHLAAIKSQLGKGVFGLLG